MAASTVSSTAPADNFRKPAIDFSVRAAEDVLMETAPIRMSPSGFKAFLEVLSKPARPVPELSELLPRAAPWESEDAEAGK